MVNEDLLFRYRAHRDDPMPPDRPLRASAGEIRSASSASAQQIQQKQQQEEIEKPPTTADSVIEEGRYLATTPRPETTTVSRPEGYVDTESEIVKKIKETVGELKETIIAGTKVAKKKVKEKQEATMERQAERDAEAISRMGNLAICRIIRTRVIRDPHLYI